MLSTYISYIEIELITKVHAQIKYCPKWNSIENAPMQYTD